MNRILLSLTILFAFGLNTNQIRAQYSTNSPFSRYGIGEMQQNSFGQDLAMGGQGAAIRSPYHINVLNPASYTAAAPHSFIFEVGVKARITQLDNGSKQEVNSTGNLDFLATRFAIKNWWHSGFGLLPNSSVGYMVRSREMMPDSSYFNQLYSGEGGTQQVYWTNAFKLFDKLSIGLEAAYMFGNIKHKRFSANESAGFSSTLISEQEILLKDFKLRAGVQYTDSLFGKLAVVLGGTYGHETQLKTNSDLLKMLFIERGELQYSDTLLYTEDAPSNVTIPMAYSAGMSLSANNQWLFAVEYSAQDWSNALFLGEPQDYLGKKTRYAAGLEYIPGLGTPQYWRNLRFRLGGSYQDSYYRIEDKAVNKYAVTLGFGLPFKRSRSLINLAVELSSEGQTGLLRQNYAQFLLNVTFQDIWFIQRKFN